MLTHLLLIIDKGAPSFCYYRHGCRGPELMPLATLKRAIAFAGERGLALTCLLGTAPLPPSYAALLAKVEHAEIVPAVLAEAYPEAILVDDGDEVAIKRDAARRQLICRISRERLAEVAAMVEERVGRCARLNVYLLDLDSYTDADIGEYERQLARVADCLAGHYRRGVFPEVNIISDRLVLNRMNNCDAGVIHLTLAPNGRFYICPAFYYDDEASSVGDLESGPGIVSGQLLTLAKAPVCSGCDAYHCKRCVYLNKKATLEWNTPSRQQCLLAHREREAARRLQGELKELAAFKCQAVIPAIDYDDPFRLAARRVGRVWTPEDDAHD